VDRSGGSDFERAWALARELDGVLAVVVCDGNDHAVRITQALARNLVDELAALVERTRSSERSG
jgi:hypothetical protein